MKILIIDDSAWNVASAKQTLDGHDITVINTVKNAYTLIMGYSEYNGGPDIHMKDFDALLTDLYLPVGNYEGQMYTPAKVRVNEINAPEGFVEQTEQVARGQIPAGLVFALAAMNAGVRTVICTDTDHHRDWICSLMDLITHTKRPEGQRKIAFVEARMVHLKAIWDEGTQTIVPAEIRGEEYDKRIWNGRFIKDWKRAMEKSYLFPEIN